MADYGNRRNARLLDTLCDEIRRLRGSAADMPRQAGLCCRALKLVSRQAQPELWAGLHFELGLCLAQLTTGNPARNLEYAITHLKEAEHIFTYHKHPEKWAGIQHNLGAVYRKRLHGSREENENEAINCYEEARKVYTRRVHPSQWADVSFNLANVYVQRVAGSRRENLDRAISLYGEVLGTITRAEYPVRWADTKINLGAAWKNYGWDDYAANVEQAIACYRDALSVLDAQYHKWAWATAQHGLGTAWMSRVKGDRGENVEHAIACFQAALQVRARPVARAYWAETAHNLALAYCERQADDRARNIEHAIELLNEVLEARESVYLTEERATTLHALANAYNIRIRGVRAENLELAIKYYTDALTIQMTSGPPEERATTHLDLAVAFGERLRKDRSVNLKQALEHLEQAAKVFTPQVAPLRCAMVHTNMADVYWKLGNLERQHRERQAAEHFEEAIAHCRAALDIYEPEAYMAKWALVQYNLGNVYADRIEGDRCHNLAMATDHYEAALKVRSADAHPLEHAQTLNNLAVTYLERADEEPQLHAARAITLFRDALKIYRELGVRVEERRTGVNLASLFYYSRDWVNAYAALRDTLRVIESMRADALGDLGQTDIALENTRLYEMMMDVCLRRGCGYYAEALLAAEANKARAFLGQMGYSDVPTPAISEELQPQLRLEQDLVQELRGYEDAIRNAESDDVRLAFIQKQDRLRIHLNDIWRELERDVPDYVALRRGDFVAYGDLQRLLDSTGPACALVEFYTLQDETIVFVLRSGEERPALVQAPVSLDCVLRAVNTFRREVTRYGYDPRRGDVQRWQELAQPLLESVLPHLDGAELVYLVPHGLLHYLPLHALRVNGECLIDRFPIAYAPSAAVLDRVIQRSAAMEQTGNGRGALVLGYTRKEEEREVFEGEAVHVARFFRTEPHLGQKATGALLREKGAQFNILHLSCHGFFDPADPLASGLQLADGVLTARDIMGMKLNADLVTLSACETGISDQQPGDELVGLTRAFLYAGASSVLVTLWSVSAVAALELMVDFYSRLRDEDGGTVKAGVVAFQEAMLEMRKKKEHPYYWAPFILVGDWQ